MAETALEQMPAMIACNQCSAPNEPPFIFCQRCGAPRIHLNRYLVLANLSLAMVAFTGTYYYAEFLAWAWPIYLFYALMFFQFSLVLVLGSGKRMARVAAWVGIFLLGCGVLFHSLRTEGPQLFLYVLEDLPALAAANPYQSLGIAIAVLILPSLILYRRWGRIYGWVNAYRIVMLAYLAIAVTGLISLQLMKVFHTRVLVPEMQTELGKFLTTTKPHFDKALGLAAVTFLRIFLFEVFVFAAVRGYQVARHVVPATPPDKTVRRESGFVRSLLGVAQVVSQVGTALENMMTYLLETIIILTADLWLVIKAFFREVLVPSAALLTACLLMFRLTDFTQSYIAENQLRTALLIAASLCAIVICDLLFLICKTAFRPSRVIEFHLQMLGWLLPNLLVFFLLVSLSLFGVAAALKGDGESSHTLPFVVGMLTKFFGAVLIILVAAILYRKRGSLAVARPSVVDGDGKFTPAEIAAQIGADDEDEEGDPAHDEGLAALQATIDGGVILQPIAASGVDSGAPPLGSPRRKKGAWDLMRDGADGQTRAAGSGRLGSKLLTVVKQNPLAENARKAMGTLQDRIHGRPEIVQRLMKAKDAYAERYYQWEALERTKDAISPETYSGLRDRYLSELNTLLSERDRLQAELDRQYAMQMVEKNMLDMKISALRLKQEEFEHLRAVGAISEKDQKSRVAPIETELRMEMARLAEVEEKLQFLQPEST